MSEYMFEAELTVELIEHEWTTLESVNDYNKSITNLRKKEWVYSSWIGRYWGERRVKEFAQCMATVKAFDLAVHGLNDEIEAVVIRKTKEKFDPAKSKEAVRRLKPALGVLQTSCKKVLNDLE